jgi:hypothetical protein
VDTAPRAVAAAIRRSLSDRARRAQAVSATAASFSQLGCPSPGSCGGVR